jgi:hypothetical protein
MESPNNPHKKIGWRKSIMCWRGGAKQETEDTARIPGGVQLKQKQKQKHPADHPNQHESTNSPIISKPYSSHHRRQISRPAPQGRLQVTRISPQRVRHNQVRAMHASNHTPMGRNTIGRELPLNKTYASPAHKIYTSPGQKTHKYVSVRHDQDSLTELSGLFDTLDGSSRSSGETGTLDETSLTSDDISDPHAYNPDGLLEATILRTDSDCSKDMSIMGAEAHVRMYNLSERVSYDVRETTRSLSTLVTKLAMTCTTPDERKRIKV